MKCHFPHRLKVITICLCGILAGISSIAAQQSPQKDTLITNEQIVVLPKDVYVGDQMEIRYTFATSIDLSSNIQLPAQLTTPEMDDLTILSITLSEADSTGSNGYVLSVQCIPWKSGIIDIPPLQEDLALEIDVPAISIQSILVHTGNQELRTLKGPILIPGTTWILWLIVLAIIAVGGSILFLLRQLKKRGLTITQFWYLIFSSPQYRRTMRTLRRLSKKNNTFDDQNFARTITHCIRSFLTEQFSFDFNAVSSSETVLIFDDLTGYTQDESVLSRIETLEQILVRMDYIRFSGDTTTSGTLMIEERTAIIKAIRETVRFLEKGPQEEKNDAAV